MIQPSPFRHLNPSPDIPRLAVMLYIRFPLSFRNVEDLLHECGIEISHETVRFWWNRFGPMFTAEIQRGRVDRVRARKHRRWRLDKDYVKIEAALIFLKKSMKRHGRPEVLVTDRLRSYGAALKDLGRDDDRERGALE
jgi:putative transposase